MESFRLDFYVYGCRQVDDIVSVLKEKYDLEKDCFRHFLKKHYVRNTYILDNSVIIYLDYQENTDYIYLSLEGCFSNYKSNLEYTYMIYCFLQENFPTRIKLREYINGKEEKLTYTKFKKTILEFYMDKYNDYLRHFKVVNVALLPGKQFYKNYKKYLKNINSVI